MILFFYKFTKIKIKSFECPKSIRNDKKNNAWNIRRLVNESFVPATQRPTYCIEDCRTLHIESDFGVPGFLLLKLCKLNPILTTELV